MAKKDTGDHHTWDTFDIALRRHESGHKVEQIAADLGTSVRTIQRELEIAKQQGMIRVLVTPPLGEASISPQLLALNLTSKYDLKGAIVVPGRKDVMDKGANHAGKEALVLYCAQVAAQYLWQTLELRKDTRTTLLVPWGRVASYIARYLRPTCPLPLLRVAPMVGVMGITDDPFEANTIAAQVASTLGGQCHLLPAPAVVATSQEYDVVRGLPLVKNTLELLAKADVVVTPLAAPDPESSTLVQKKLVSGQEITRLIDKGAIGEVAGHIFFNERGEEVLQGNAQPIGLGLQGLKNVIGAGGTVIAVVAAAQDRIKPLKVALGYGLANVVITDSVTAQSL